MKNEAYESLLQLIKKYNNNYNGNKVLEYCRTEQGEHNNNNNIMGITQKDAEADCGEWTGRQRPRL